MINQTKNSTSTSTLLPNKIVKTVFLANTVSKEEDLITAYKSYITLCENKPYRRLVIISSNAFFDLNDEMICKTQRIHPVAIAFVSNKLSFRLTLKTYSKLFSKSNFKIFKCENEATNWLNSIKVNSLSI